MSESHPLVDALGCLSIVVFIACFIFLAGTLGWIPADVPPGP